MHIVSLSFDDGLEKSNRLTTTSYGPGNCEHHLDAAIEALLAQPQGWLIYNTHGLDDEGWGPIRASYLENLFQRLTKIDSVQILPVYRALTTQVHPSFEIQLPERRGRSIP